MKPFASNVARTQHNKASDFSYGSLAKLTVRFLDTCHKTAKKGAVAVAQAKSPQETQAMQNSGSLTLADSLQSGRLRQFSAQYGGWLRVTLVLFHHALMVDPDGETNDAVMITPRKRRNSLTSIWRELVQINDIVTVRKLTDPVSVVPGWPCFRFVIETQSPDVKFQFEADSENVREEWIRSLMLAKKMYVAQQLRSASDSDVNGQDGTCARCWLACVDEGLLILS